MANKTIEELAKETIEEITKETIELVKSIASENELNANTTEKPPQNKRKTKRTPRKPRKGLSIRTVSLQKMYKQMLTIMSREIAHFMVKSHQENLSDKQATTLVNYLKVYPQLIKNEEELSSNITEEELERIVAKSSKSK